MAASIIVSQYHISNHTPYNPLGATTGKGQALISQPGLSAPGQLDASSPIGALGRFDRAPGSVMSKEDALNQLWRDEHRIDLNQPDKKYSLYFGTDTSAFLEFQHQLETEGLSGKVDWARVSDYFAAKLSHTHAGNLSANMDELASVYVALSSQLERNHTGDELALQKDKLAQFFAESKEQLIGGYVNRLKDVLGLSEADAGEIRLGMEDILAQRVDAMQSAQKQMADTLSGTKDAWLKNHSGYMASQLRSAAGTAEQVTAKNGLTLQDMTGAGMIAGEYQMLYQKAASANGGNEGIYALHVSMIDMKAQTLADKGLLSEKMAQMLQGSKAQRHEMLLDVADQRQSVWRAEAQAGLAETMPDMNRDLFGAIYHSVMDTFHQNGGDALDAIRKGAAFGQNATAQAGKENPKVSRWRISMDTYWKDFYTSREVSDLHGGKRVQISAYEGFVCNWNQFTSAFSSVQTALMDARA